MITHIPSAEDFKSSGIDFLNIAWGNVTELLLQYYGVPDLDVQEDPEEVFWQASERTLASSLTLLQQGQEFILKGRIAEVSPFLLLVDSPSRWPSRCDQRNVPFSEFRTIDAHEPIRAHNAVAEERLDDEFRQHFNALRRQRNTVMHTVHEQLEFSAHQLVKAILESSHHLFGAQRWLELREEYLLRGDPMVRIYGIGDVTPSLIAEFHHVTSILNREEVQKYFGFDKNRQMYICPRCQQQEIEYFLSEAPPTALLQPNTPESTTIVCQLCGTETEVLREPCYREECGSDVLHSRGWTPTCLVCDKSQS